MATTINAGRVRFVSRGTYNNSTQYYLFDLVDYNGSSYIAKENTVGNVPTNTQYWQLIAEKGNTGSTGQTGPVGPTGNGIASITKTATVGLVDTYTITYTNGNTTTFTITNGEDGEVTETELNVLREKVANQQKVISQLPQVTGQGTSITLENTIEAQFTKFDVEGHSEQGTTEGKNKLSFTENTISYAGVTTNISETKMKFNGKMVSVTNIFNKIREDKAVPAGTYKLSYTKLSGSTSGSGDWAVYFNFYNADGTRIANKSFASNESGKVTAKDLVLSENVAYYSYYAYCNSTSLTFNDLELGFMIEPGTTATNYEPYTGGIASPNPNYEQPIYSAGDNENLFDIDSVTSVIRGQIPDENKVIYTNENTSGNFNVIPNFSTLELKSTTYFISMDIRRETGSLIFGKINDGNSDWTLVKAPSLSNDYNRYIYKKTYSENTSINRILIQFVGEGSASIKNIKLEQGKASGYSPYGMGSINEKIQTRNVVPNNAISQIKNGVELIKNEDGSFTLNGTASANFDITFATNFTLKAGVYTSSIKQQIKNGLYYSFDNIADTMLNGNSGKRKTTFTLNADKTYSRAFLWIDNGTTFNNETYFIQTEPGSTESSYVPHKEQDYPIFVQQPFRSIGDVRDCFVKKSDGKLYERHLPYIASYNGETLPQDVYNEVDNVKYCNEKSMSTTGQFSIGASVQYIDENNWNDLPCTEEQIQQLENKPSTYKEMTIINSEDETPAYLEVSGIYDLNNIINN